MDDRRPLVGDDLCGLFSQEAFPAGKIATASCPNSSSNERSVGISATSHLLGVTHTVRRCAGRNETWRIDRIRSAPWKPQGGPLLHASPAARTPIYGSWIGLADGLASSRLA